MISNERLIAFLAAIETGDLDEAKATHVDLRLWILTGGPEPAWTDITREDFMAWTSEDQLASYRRQYSQLSSVAEQLLTLSYSSLDSARDHIEQARHSLRLAMVPYGSHLKLVA